MAQPSEQFAVLSLQFRPGHELHIYAVLRSEELTSISDLFGLHPAKQAEALCPDIGVHGIDLAERARP
jgi:hypothetical protein